MCYRPQLVNTSFGPRVCSCGHCVECRKARTNDVAHRLYLAGRECPSVHFWTLTYSNAKLPLMVRPTKEYLQDHDLYACASLRYGSVQQNFGYVAPELLVFDRMPRPYEEVVVTDRADGLGQDIEFVKHDPCFDREMFNTTADYVSSPFKTGQIFDLNGEILDDSEAIDWTYKRRLRKLYFRDYDDNKNRPVFYKGFSIAPTINNRDVQLWIKRFKGCDGHKNSYKFKYFFCGEYGPQTDRPHFHMITFGLTDSQCARMKAEWIKMFGDSNSTRRDLTKFSRVNRIDINGQDRLPRAARYVGKYVSKGKYESYLVTDGYSRRPHSCSSKDLWRITPEEFDWYTGADLLEEEVKKYVVSEAFKKLSRPVQEFQAANGIHRFLPREYYSDEVLEQIKLRLFYHVPNTNEKYKYSLGKSIKNKLFKSLNYEKFITNNGKHYVLEFTYNDPVNGPRPVKINAANYVYQKDGEFYFTEEFKTIYGDLPSPVLCRREYETFSSGKSAQQCQSFLDGPVSCVSQTDQPKLYIEDIPWRSSRFSQAELKYVSTPLSLALSDFVRAHFMEDLIGKFREVKQQTESPKVTDWIKQVRALYEDDFNARKTVAEKNYREFLKNTKVL